MSDQNPLKALLDHLAQNKIEKANKGVTPGQHKFWNTQPVPRNGDIIEEDGPIEADKQSDEIRSTPYPLQADFEWFLVDINDEKDRRDTYELLSANYVEADDASFRFDYTADFLKWALQPPGWRKEYHLGIRVAKSKKMVAFISGVPADLRVREKLLRVVEINFLCIHKKLRSKRLAPVLIKEITRRVNQSGIFQAVYTAGAYLPRPVTTARYYHRSIQAKKLVEIEFSTLGRDMTMSKLVKYNKLPAVPQLPGIEEMKPEYVPRVKALLDEYLAKFPFAPSLSEEDIKHWLLPTPNVIYSYIVKDEESGDITDFISFYSLPSTVVGNTKHTHLYAAYLFYYVPRGMGADKERIKALVNDALILAKNAKFDVFNCLGLAENECFLEDLKFGPGNGYLHYYMFNYRCRDLNPDKLSLVML